MSTPAKELKPGKACWEILRNGAATWVLVLMALRLDGWLSVAAWVLVVLHGAMTFFAVAGLGVILERTNRNRGVA